MWETVMNTALTMLVGLVVTAIFNGAINLPKKKRAKEEDLRLLKKGIQALLKNDLKVRYDYWLDEGYAPEDAREDLEAEYRVYHSLGKNGVMDGRRSRFLDLPTETPYNKGEG
jgi:hypothetical protein